MRRMFSEKQIEKLASEVAQSEIEKTIPDYENLEVIEIEIEEEDEQIELDLKEDTYYHIINTNDYGFSILSNKILAIEGNSPLSNLIDTLQGLEESTRFLVFIGTNMSSLDSYFFFSKGIIHFIQIAI